MLSHASVRPAFSRIITTLTLLVGAASASAASDAASWARAARAGELEFSGQLIVRPLPGLDAGRDGVARQRLAGRLVKYYAQTDEYVVRVDAPGGPGAGEQRLGAELLATGDYQYVHPNWICSPVTSPNDPSFPVQWHHTMMQSPMAWEMTTGSASVICAFTDTGIDLTHPDLAAHRVPGFDAVADLAETDGASVSDLNGHGTHVAGCAAAIGNNSTGVCGVGWDLSLMMVRVAFNSGGSAYLDDILQGARWAVDHGARIASSSYSGVNNAAVETTGAYIKAAGGLYLYAAGNSGSDWSTFDYPSVIVVGASDETDNRAGFSGYGLAVDVFAPGTDILSSCNGGGYCYSSGTSMATPVANGVIGMIFSANPALTAQQAEDILFASCDDWGAPGNDTISGWGRVNTFKAVKAALAASGPVAPVAVADDGGTTMFGEARSVDVLANDFDVNDDPVTIQTFDAVSVAGGTVNLSVGTGSGGRDQVVYEAPASFVGTDAFTYTAQDLGGLTDTATVTVQVGAPSDFRDPENPASAGPGVRASYYELPGTTSVLPDYATLSAYLSETVPDVNYPSTTGTFAGSGRADDVGARFEGYITVPRTDFYTFYTNSDDGSRLVVGSSTVVNNDGLHGMLELGGVIGLKVGAHAVTVDYFERAGSAGLIVSVAGGGLAKQAIPGALWSRALCPADYNGDGFVDGIDYDQFNNDFENPDPAQQLNADFNGDGFVDGIDYDDFMNRFGAGC